MPYSMFLRAEGINEKEVLIDDEEYKGIVDNLNSSKLVVLKNGTVLNAIHIKRIEPRKQTEVISKEFRLPAANETIQTEEEKELKMVKAIDRMETLFDDLKGKGMFGKFKDYQDYCLKVEK